MTAMYLGILTDHFGDIPYSDALQGADKLKAEYDSQQDIYATIFSLLADGKANLLEPSDVMPGGDDLIHGGDLAAWAATADGLRARYLNHFPLGLLDSPRSPAGPHDYGFLGTGFRLCFRRCRRFPLLRFQKGSAAKRPVPVPSPEPT